MCVCSLDGCNNKCFEKEDECILHCEKDENNNWYKTIKNQNRIWDIEKLNFFWQSVTDYILVVNYTYSQMGKASQKIMEDYNYEYFQYEFNQVIFPIFIIDDIPFRGLNPNINIDFLKCKFLSAIDFRLLIEAKNIKFMECIFFKPIIFENMEFKSKFLFESCKVSQDIYFINVIFNNVTSFMNTSFYEKLSFTHSRFEDIAIFNLLKGGTFFLINTSFQKKVNFLSMDLKVHDRETARIIKNSFEKENNIIEANRFYALEMKGREKELNQDIKNGKNIMEWFVFKAHSIASNHSQDYILPVLWILNLALFMSMSTSTFYHNNMLAYISAFVMFISSLKINKVNLLKTVLVMNFAIFYFLSYVNLDDIAKLINPFSVMTGKETLTFGLLVYKVTIAYLIYQFIVSVRQNTRRK